MSFKEIYSQRIDLEEVELDEYFEKWNVRADILTKYVANYNNLDSDLERINFTANLASLKAEYANQQEEIGRYIDRKVSKLKTRIFDYDLVHDPNIEFNGYLIYPPKLVEEKDSIKEVTRAFIFGLQHFVDVLTQSPLQTINALLG